VAVTGSTGLIGSALVEELRSAGHEVVRLVRRVPGEEDERWWDPDKSSLDPGVLAAVDAVVHLAGAGIGDRRWSAARRRQLVSSRVDSTALLAGAMATSESPPSVLLCASAVGIYGDRGDEILTEQSAPGTGFLAELCRQWEQAAAPAATAGIRIVQARSGIVLSARGGALGRQLPLFRLGLGGRLGSGGQWTSWVSLEDEVRALRFALEHGTVSGPVNVASPAPVTNRDFTAALGRALHRPAVLAVPAFALRLAVGRGLADEALLASQRVRPAVLEAAGFSFAHEDLAAALDASLSD
jgi:uncharacterized protein (TIGR01777 family)